MAYKKLSDLVNELPNAQQSEAFVQRFRAAVRTGEIEAADLPERFVLPKVYRPRSEGGRTEKQVRDMLFSDNRKIQQWVTATAEELSQATGRQRRPRVSYETIEAGQVDFAELAAETRRKLQARYEKGQQLGKSRAKKTGSSKKG